jgi:hypothetical protein
MWRPSANFHGTQAPRWIDMAACVVPAHAACQVGKNHDREFEALGFVYGHQAHAVAALLEDRRFRRFPFAFLPQLVDEAAERNAAAELVLTREFGDVKNIRERLLPCLSKDETDVCTRFGQQTPNRVGDWSMVSASVQSLQKSQRFADRRKV